MARLLFYFFLGAASLFPLLVQAENYPKAEQGSVVDDYQGVRVADPYRWLEDLKSKQTQAWLAEEAKFTNAFFATIPEVEYFRKRLTELLDKPSEGKPTRYGHRLFSWHRDNLNRQSVLYVQDSDQSPTRVLLDPNQLSETGTIVVVGTSISPDGGSVIYWTTKNGSDRETYHVLSVETGREVEKMSPSVRVKEPVWIRSGAGFFYSGYRWQKMTLTREVEDEGIYYHRLGDDPKSDRLVVPPPGREGCVVRGTLSPEGRYLFVSITHSITAENKLLCLDLGAADEPNFDLEPKVVVGHWGAGYVVVSKEGPILYLLSTYEAARGQLLAVDLNDVSEERWKTILPEGEGFLASVYPLGDYFVSKTIRDGGQRLMLFSKRGVARGEIVLPGPGVVDSVSLEDSGTFLYLFASAVMPPCWFRYDPVLGKSEQLSKSGVLSLAAAFESQTVYYTSRDGLEIPMVIMQKKGLAHEGRNPLILYGYGGFGLYDAPRAKPTYFAWMERGGIVALPALRGDGGLGEIFRRAGMREGKLTTISDFLAAAEWLCDKGYTSPSRLVISGGSNGAMVAAAAINQRPDLFRVALLRSGPMDMLRWQILARSESWKGEYGTSENVEDFHFLGAYSPLKNIKPAAQYPACLVLTGDHDGTVHPAHSFKYVATLQATLATVSGAGPVVLDVERDAGHRLDRPGGQVLNQIVNELAFAAHFTMSPSDAPAAPAPDEATSK